MALDRILLRSIFAGALGGLLFGFDTAVISGTTHALMLRFHLSPLELGFTVSIALWGTVLGALTSGVAGQRIGGRGTLRILAVFYALSSLGCALAPNWPAFLIARFLGGLAIGGSSVLGPVYIAELAPPAFRGRMVGLFQVNTVFGILLAYVSNFVIASMRLGAVEWRWEFGVCVLPSLLFFLMLYGIPESARWLVTQGRIQDALNALCAVGVPQPEVELRAMVASLHTERSSRAAPLFRWCYRVPIALALVIAAFNQLSGINAVLYYLNDIFVSAGFTRLAGTFQAVVVGVVNLLMTLVAMTLIDRFGRRTLLLWGTFGMSLTLGAIALIFHNAVGHEWLLYLVALYIAAFAISSGAVVWVYMSEIFPSAVRVKGQALGSTVLWIMNSLISQAFPWIAARSAALPFAFFGAMMATQFVVTLVWFPETKGLSLEALQEKLEAHLA